MTHAYVGFYSPLSERTGLNLALPCRLAVVLISRMIFNLREAGTEVCEGTEEWRNRIDRSIKLEIMRFRVPTELLHSDDGDSELAHDGLGESEHYSLSL